MEEANGIKWLVEDREQWKRRALAAEAELVVRDSELSAKAETFEGRQLRDLVRFTFVDIPIVNITTKSNHSAAGAICHDIGLQLLRDQSVRATRNPTTDSVRVGVLVVPPSEGVMTESNLSRWFRPGG